MNTALNPFKSLRFTIFSILFSVFILGILAGVAVSGLTGISFGEQQNSLKASADSKEEIFVDLAIDYGNGNMQSFPGEMLVSGSTVFDLLEAIERRHGIQLETRNFPGIGMFVEGIHSIRNTNTMYWQYWVNGKYADVGAEQHELQDGDEVLWKRTSERPQF